jgi:hypothetical protein
LAHNLRSYHLVWLASHPDRTEAWLRERLRDNFHVHHKDGNHKNDSADNLILLEGTDHMRLHGRYKFTTVKTGTANLLAWHAKRNHPRYEKQRRASASKAGKARWRGVSKKERSEALRKASLKRWRAPSVVEIKNETAASC